MRRRYKTTFALVVALAALAALSIGSSGGAALAASSASAAQAGGQKAAIAQNRRARRLRRLAARIARRVARRVARRQQGPRGPQGPAGPPGPQGPQGATQTPQGVSGGNTKVFYAVNGVGPTQTLIDANNFNLQNSCDGSSQQIEARTSLDNAMVRYGGHIPETNAVISGNSDDFDIGDTFTFANADDDALFDLQYANIIGQLVSGTFSTEEDANDIFVSTDCMLVGEYTAV
jgi:hypothetical protein